MSKLSTGSLKLSKKGSWPDWATKGALKQCGTQRPFVYVETGVVCPLEVYIATWKIIRVLSYFQLLPSYVYIDIQWNFYTSISPIINLL